MLLALALCAAHLEGLLCVGGVGQAAAWVYWTFSAEVEAARTTSRGPLSVAAFRSRGRISLGSKGTLLKGAQASCRLKAWLAIHGSPTRPVACLLSRIAPSCCARHWNCIGGPRSTDSHDTSWWWHPRDRLRVSTTEAVASKMLASLTAAQPATQGSRDIQS